MTEERFLAHSCAAQLWVFLRLRHMEKYTIYLVNTGADAQLFCCFLERPQELASDPEVFANSEVSLRVTPDYKGLNRFVIPVQYVVAAGASTDPVALNAQVNSSIMSDANLTDTWDATYADAPPRQEPGLAIDASKVGKNQIAISSNHFNKVHNENNHWFGSQSLGLMTDAGFIGMTWSPSPGQTRTLTLTPKPTFYVAIGNYGSNSLADWTTILKAAHAVHVPTDFKYGECTVTYDESGNFHVSQGKPATILAAANEVRAPVTLDQRGLAGGQVAFLKSVYWRSGPEPGSDYTSLTGNITVDRTLAAGLTFFVLSNVIFTLGRNTQGQTAVRFSYSGAESANTIKSLFKAGATLFFR
jgi:hypothetical protein